MTIRGLLVDFYGTLARATTWVSADEVLAEHGYTLDDEHRAIYFADGLDGVEHDEHSQSRDHYVAWQRERTLAMLAASDVHPGEYEAIIEQLRGGAESRVLEPYDEVPGVLAAVRARGLPFVICSNWDWDLREAVAESGLADAVDAMVSSAWVGARKPHPRIYGHTLEQMGVGADEVLFVGDTWSCDVDGPRAAGMRTVYVRRDHFETDHTAPADHERHADVHRAADLGLLLSLTNGETAS